MANKNDARRRAAERRITRAQARTNLRLKREKGETHTSGKGTRIRRAGSHKWDKADDGYAYVGDTIRAHGQGKGTTTTRMGDTRKLRAGTSAVVGNPPPKRAKLPVPTRPKRPSTANTAAKSKVMVDALKKGYPMKQPSSGRVHVRKKVGGYLGGYKRKK